MLKRHFLRCPIRVRRHHDHRIKMAVVPLQRNLQQIIEADRGDYDLQPQRLDLPLVMMVPVMLMHAHDRRKSFLAKLYWIGTSNSVARRNATAKRRSSGSETTNQFSGTSR